MGGRGGEPLNRNVAADDKLTRLECWEKTKRQKDKKINKKTSQRQKERNMNRQRPTREFDSLLSGQYHALSMFSKP